MIPQERITLAFDSASKVCRSIDTLYVSIEYLCYVSIEYLWSEWLCSNQYPVGRRGIPFVALSCFFNIVTITRTITAWTVMQLIQTLK